MFYTYILYSEVLKRYYIGSCCADLEGRLRRHLSNHKGFTAKAKDWVVVYTKVFPSRSEVEAMERQIKKWRSMEMIQKLINSASRRDWEAPAFSSVVPDLNLLSLAKI